MAELIVESFQCRDVPPVPPRVVEEDLGGDCTAVPEGARDDPAAATAQPLLLDVHAQRQGVAEAAPGGECGGLQGHPVRQRRRRQMGGGAHGRRGVGPVAGGGAPRADRVGPWEPATEAGGRDRGGGDTLG